MRLLEGLLHQRPNKRRQAPRAILQAERLEDRTVPTTLVSDFSGLTVDDTVDRLEPPDPIAAVGPSHIVEGVNTTLAIYTKTGTQLLEQQFADFFAPVRQGNFMSDPFVAYDEQADRFFVGILDFNVQFFFSSAHLLYAVSDSSDPTVDTNGDGRAFSEMHAINVTEPGALGFTVMGDYPRIGWNADAHVFTVNMFEFNFFGIYDHLSVLTVDKSTVLDADPATFTVYHADRDTSHFTMAPATMHGSLPGDPMYFVEDVRDGSHVRVVKMTNILSATPTFSDTEIAVDPFTVEVGGAYGGPDADQPGGVVEANDPRMLNAEWRDNHLVATHAAATGDSDVHAIWYEFDTSGTPTLLQQGMIDPAPGVDTYYPAIAIAQGGALGLTYMQSSPTEFMSVYVTARSPGDAAGAMQAPVLVKAGEGTYGGSRAGDYAGISVDPVDNSFWAVNEWARTPTNAFWGTWVANFTADAAVEVHDVAVMGISAPPSVNQGSIVTVNVTVHNQGSASETFDVTLTDTPAGGGTPGTITPSTQTVTLAAGSSTVVSFSWNTTGASTGSHTLTATASAVPGETDLGDNSLSTTVTVTTPPPVGGIYVWDIVFESRNRGSKHDERILVTIRRDSDNDGVAEATDAVVQGATVNVELDGPDPFLRTFSGVTNRSGVLRSEWFLDVPSGAYVAEVFSLTHPSFSWDRNLDPTANDTDTDADNFPEQRHTNPHGGGSGVRPGPGFLPPGQDRGGGGRGGPRLPNGLAPAGSKSPLPSGADAPSAGKPPLQPAGVDSFFAATFGEEGVGAFPPTRAVPSFIEELLAIDALFDGHPGVPWLNDLA